jgi:hypothetical protein
LKHLSTAGHRVPPPFHVASKPTALETLEFMCKPASHLALRMVY